MNISHINENPLYPIPLADYPKLFDYAITAQGLVYFNRIRRRFLLGQNLSHDEYNKLRLLYSYYATTHRNMREVRNWRDLCFRLEKEGIDCKRARQSQEDLITQKLIIKNPDYHPGLYRLHVDYVKKNYKGL